MKYIKTRISAMMFLYYFALGIIIPVFSLYLKNHTNLTEGQIGLVQGMQMISSIITPILGVLVIDRVISAERTFSILQLFSGFILISIFFVKSFPAILILNLLYWLTMGPCTPLTNAIAFHHIKTEKNKFGFIRLFGTMGWMIAGLSFGLIWQGVLKGSEKEALIFAGIASFILFFYSLTLPGIKDSNKRAVDLSNREMLKIFLKPSVILICILSILVRMVDKFFYTGVPIFMEDLGFVKASIMPWMTVGQITEIAAMFSLSFLLEKFSYRTLLRWGIISEMLRFGFLALAQFLKTSGASSAVYSASTIAGLTFHGFAFALFFTTAFIYLDNKTNDSNRSGVHQIFALVTGVLSGFLGNFLGGKLLGTFHVKTAAENYVYYWLVPFGISAAALILTLMLRRIKSRTKSLT